MSKRFLIFIVLLSTILLMIWSVVWFRIFIPLELNGFYFAAALVLTVSSYLLQIYRFIQFQTGDAKAPVLFVTYFFFGLFIYLFLATILKEALLFFNIFSEFEKNISFGILGSSFLLTCIGVFHAYKGPQVVHTKIKLKEKYINLIGTKIVQISDLHVGPLIQKKYVEAMVGKINSLNADLIVLTGDIGDGEASHFEKDLHPLKELKSKFGTYYVPGNHEYYWNIEEWIELVSRQKITPLINRGIALSQNLLWLGGVADYAAYDTNTGDKPDFDQSLKECPSEAYKILLAHRPLAYLEAEKRNYDLLLCGHTHNGQFFPFNFLVGFFNPYSKGLNYYKNLLIYVNRGTGFWGPPLRLGVRSEITLIELT